MTNPLVIQRKDGKYVSKPGAEHSYTNRLESARVFLSRAEAERDLCHENERIISIADLIG